MFKYILYSVVLLLVNACSQPSQKSPDAPPVDSPSVVAGSTTSPPPGFTDPPPPAPTSDTLILSGGILVSDTPNTDSMIVITDSMIVVTDGLVVDWGRRGDVETPNDSVGFDMHGKWIQAVNGLTSGATADLLVFDQFPTDSTIQAIGTVKSSEVNMPKAD